MRVERRKLSDKRVFDRLLSVWIDTANSIQTVSVESPKQLIAGCCRYPSTVRQ